MASQVGTTTILRCGLTLRWSGLSADAAAAISRALGSEIVPQSQRVRDLSCYLFRAFIRRVNRVKRRQLTAEAAIVSHLTAAPRSTNPMVDIEVHILTDELLARCDSKTCDMFYRRIHGFVYRSRLDETPPTASVDFRLPLRSSSLPLSGVRNSPLLPTSKSDLFGGCGKLKSLAFPIASG
jgi:hypothetical protein